MDFGHKIKRRSRKSLFKKGRAPHISRNLNVRYRPVEIKYLSLGLQTCPNLRCHNKKGGGNNTRHSRKGKRLR
jgi:hypothetical protein